MQICTPHWEIIRQSVTEHGLDSLISKTGDEAIARSFSELDPGVQTEEDLDPLMSMTMHWMTAAIENGGLDVMFLDEQGNHQCPICLFEKHSKGFIAKVEIDNIAKQMQTWCMEKGLISKLQ